MANDTAKTLTIGGVTYPIEDEIARQTLLNIVSQVGSLQNALDAMTNSDTTTAIETFQEVLDFLSGVTDSDTLVGKLNELRTLINGKVTAETGKGLSSNDYTTAEKTKLAGIAAGAEVNVQPDWEQTNSSADDFIKNKPVLSDVATSGSYEDLDDTPDIPMGDYKVSVTHNDRSGVTTSDKTYAEIAQAIEDGYRVFVVVNSTTIYFLTATGNSRFMFSCVDNSTFSVVEISSSGVSVSTYGIVTNVAYNTLQKSLTKTQDGFTVTLITFASVAISGSYNDLSDTPTIPTALSSLSEDSTHRTVTDAEKATWGGKQNALTFDSTPTANSTNPVTSGGVKTYVDGKTSMPIVSLTPTNNVATLEASKYYLLGNVGSSTASSNVLTLSFTTSQNEALSYMGRFTAVADALSLSLPSGIHFNDDVPGIKANHAYEFNILYDTCLLTDITYTNPNANS